jgi:uncharacterized protein
VRPEPKHACDTGNLEAAVSLSSQFIAHPSGALWIPSSRSLVIADLHLGYGWAQRRRGELGPLADTRARDKLFAVVREMAPAEIVFLGDIVHAPRPSPPEREWTEQILLELSKSAQLIAVRGNHDRAFSREYGHLAVTTVPAWETDSLIAIHGDRLDVAIPENRTVLIGHVHPCLAIKDAAGASQKLPLFVYSTSCILLPAFSPFAAGFDIGRAELPTPLLKFFGTHPISAVAVSGRRAVPLGPLDQAIARLAEADSSAPAQYRRLRRRTTRN